MMMEMQTHAVSLDHTVNSEEMRCMLIAPNDLPFNVRRNTLMCLASDLFNRKSPYPKETSDVIKEIIGSDEWEEMRNAAEKSDLLPKFILKTVFSSVFPSMSSQPETCDVSEAMKKSWKKISSHIRTMDIIASLSPGTGFDYSVRDAHSEFMENDTKYENLTERNDDLEQIVKIMRSMGSELISRVKDRRENAQNKEIKKRTHGEERKERTYSEKTQSEEKTYSKERNIFMVIDTSNSMYGEPEMISKGLVLALTKRFLRNKDVNVTYFSSGLPVLSPSSGKDMMNLISHRSGSGEQFARALEMLLERMRCGLMHNTDLILLSKGAGVINDPNFTRDWEAYTMKNNIRTITAVPGGCSACGLTELSENVLIFDDTALKNKTGEFAKLVDILLQI